MTVVWNVNDLKVSHKNPWEITKLAKWLSSIYGDIKIQRGTTLEYLWMNLYYSTPGEVKISMIPYVNEILANFLEEIWVSLQHWL